MQDNFLCVIFSRQNVKKTEDAWRHQETIKYKKKTKGQFLFLHSKMFVFFLFIIFILQL